MLFRRQFPVTCKLPQNASEDCCLFARLPVVLFFIEWSILLLFQVQDRLKIRKKGMGEDVMLGRQSFLNCAPYEGYSAGCMGGDPIDIFKYMAEFGLPDESCYSCVPLLPAPYSSPPLSKLPCFVRFCMACAPT